MDSSANSTLPEIEELICHDPNMRSPMRARRRQSDAKWRASVATCYETLKRVVPKNPASSTKRKVSKAVILQESERYILHLESVLKRLVTSDSQAQSKVVAWMEQDQWTPCTLKHFQEDFAQRQHKIFHSSNQGRRCYNLLDEIKDEVFSLSVDPDSIAVMDKGSSKLLDPVSGKEISLFPQFPPPSHHHMADSQNLNKPVSKPAATQSDRQSNTDSHVPDKQQFTACQVLTQELDDEEQTVPTLESAVTVVPDDSSSSFHVPWYDTLSDIPKSPPFLSYDDRKCKTSQDSQRVKSCFGPKSLTCEEIDDGDQEVPDSGGACHVPDQELPGEDGPLIDLLEHVEVSPGESSIRKKPTRLCASTRAPHSQCLTGHMIAGAVSGSASSFIRRNIWTQRDKQSCTAVQETEHPTFLKPDLGNFLGRSATARKLQFNQPEDCTVCNLDGTTEPSAECSHPRQRNPNHNGQKDHHNQNHSQPSQPPNFLHADPSPMLAAGFTPVKLPSSVSHCVTCEHPDESLVSPWKSVLSPFQNKKQSSEKSPMIDPEHSLFCLEPMDSILAEENTSDVSKDERTPALHSVTDDFSRTQQLYKRKLGSHSVEVVTSKPRPKCRRRLEGLYDNKESFAFGATYHDISAASKSVKDCGGDEDQDQVQVVPTSHTSSTVNNIADVDSDEGALLNKTFNPFHDKASSDVDDSKRGILSPLTGSRLLWMTLPSPCKLSDTSEYAQLPGQVQGAGSSSSLPLSVGDLSQDLLDVEVMPFDLKECSMSAQGE